MGHPDNVFPIFTVIINVDRGVVTVRHTIPTSSISTILLSHYYYYYYFYYYYYYYYYCPSIPPYPDSLYCVMAGDRV